MLEATITLPLEEACLDPDELRRWAIALRRDLGFIGIHLAHLRMTHWQFNNLRQACQRHDADHGLLHAATMREGTRPWTFEGATIIVHRVPIG